jgi:hypothetical protein
MFFRKFSLANIVAVWALLLPACGGTMPSNLPAAVDPRAVPTSVPATVVASPKASGAPAQTPANTLLSWVNGAQIPASFPGVNLGALGPLHQRLPASPQLDPNSASYISYYFAGNAPDFDAGWVDADRSQAQYDYNFPVYIALPSDPLVTIVCNNLSAAPCVDGGEQIHMPALARQAGGTDQQLVVLESTGLEYDFWLVSSNPPYSNGSSFSAAGEGHFSSAGSNDGPNFVAPGFDIGSASAAGAVLSASQLYTSELSAGVINHAVSFVFPCGTNAWVFPASQATGVCANGAGMPLGSRVWWQPTDAQTDAMLLGRDITTVLVAMHHYGGFFTNNGGGSVNINGQGGGMGAQLENQEPYWIYGNGVDPALNYAMNAFAMNESGWVDITTTQGVHHYLLTVLGSRVDFLDNLKVVASCVTQKTC